MNMKSIFLRGVVVNRIDYCKYNVFIPYINENKPCKISIVCKPHSRLTGGDSVTIEYSVYDMDLQNGKIIEAQK